MRAIGELAIGGTTRLALRRVMPRALADAAWPHFDQGTQRAILRLYRTSPEERLAQAGSDLGRLACPALVLWGDRDPFVPDTVRRRLRRGAPGRARAEHLPDAGHWPWHDRPDVVERVLRFLAEPL